MQTIRFRYGVILISILSLSFLWEFWLEDVVMQYWFPGSEIESFSERVEYIITVVAFCFVSLLYPYFHAKREERWRKNQEIERDHLMAQLQEAFAEIKTLQGMITICSLCKKIREEKDVWTQLEAYLYEHSDATFSHGLCPDCFEMQMSVVKQGRDSDRA